MSDVLGLTRSVTGATSRLLVDHVARELGLPVTSELSYPTPEGFGGVVARPVAAVSRVEFGDAGSVDRRVVVVVELYGAGARLLGDGDGVDLVVAVPEARALYRGHLGDGGVSLVRREVREWSSRAPSRRPHASNDDVEELTRRAHTLSWEEWDLARSVIGADLAVVPVLSSPPHLDLVGPGDEVAHYLRALRDVEGGVPVEWALRRAVS